MDEDAYLRLIAWQANEIRQSIEVLKQQVNMLAELRKQLVEFENRLPKEPPKDES